MQSRAAKSQNHRRETGNWSVIKLKFPHRLFWLAGFSGRCHTNILFVLSSDGNLRRSILYMLLLQSPAAHCANFLNFIQLVQYLLVPAHAHLYGVLGEDEGFHGRPDRLGWLLRSTLLQTIHLLKYLHLLVNAFYFLQTKSDPSLEIQNVEISADFIVGLSAVHSSPNNRQSGFQLLLLTVPLNLTLSMCCHGNQVWRAGGSLEQKAHITL